MDTRRVGEWALVAGGVLTIVGSFGRWSSVTGLGDAEFVDVTERRFVLAAGVVLLVVGVLEVLPALHERWPRWLTVLLVWGVALVVGLCFIDSAKKIDSVKGEPYGHVGWGLWLASAGAVVGLLGLLGELVARRDEALQAVAAEAAAADMRSAEADADTGVADPR